MTTTDTTYQGWTNYETWNVNLWIGNDEGSYRYWREQALDVWIHAEISDVLSRSDNARIALADRLKDEIDTNMPDEIQAALGASMYSDLLNAALSEVNWFEIANAILEAADLEGYEAQS